MLGRARCPHAGWDVICLSGSPQSCRLAARCPEPVAAGQRGGNHIYSKVEEETTNVLSVAKGKRNKSNTATDRQRKISFFFFFLPGLVYRCDDDSLEVWFLAGGETECQSCHKCG